MFHVDKFLPGKNGHSTNPRISLTATSCPKLCTAPLHVDTTPQTVAAQLKYIEGGRRVMRRLDGNCIIRYLSFVSQAIL